MEEGAKEKPVAWSQAAKGGGQEGLITVRACSVASCNIGGARP